MKVSEINRKAALFGGLASAAGSIIGGVLGYKGAKDAAGEASDAAAYAADIQKEMYDQSREDLQPWRETGANALAQVNQKLSGTVGALGEVPGFYKIEPWEQSFKTYQDELDWLLQHREDIDSGAGDFGDEYRTPEHRALINKYISQIHAMDPADWSREMKESDASLLGGGPPGFEEVPEFTESPGYQFTLQEGLNAQQNALSAMGQNRSGKHLKAAAEYAEGLASTEYDNFLNRWYRGQAEKRNAFNSQINPYLALSGMGQTATQNTAQLGAGSAAAQGNYAWQGGIARGAGDINQTNALTGAITGGINNALYANSLRNLQQPGYTPYQSGTPNLTGQPVDQWQY